MFDQILEYEYKIKALEEQIEKMKCCSNCIINVYGCNKSQYLNKYAKCGKWELNNER
jgi:hypothetical protein